MKKTKRQLKKLLMKEWSKRVRERDNYFCIWCNKRNKKNHAHHIVARSLSNFYGYVDIINGFTLCYRCHIYRILKEPDEYIAIRDSWLTERHWTYPELRRMYQNPIRTTLEDYEWKLNQLKGGKNDNTS